MTEIVFASEIKEKEESDAAFLREVERRAGAPLKEMREILASTKGSDQFRTNRENMLAFWLRRILGAKP